MLAVFTPSAATSFSAICRCSVSVRNFAESHARLQRERDVFAHRQFGDDAAVLAVLGAEPQAEPQRIGGIVELRGFAIDADVARVARVEREQQARELGAARA